MYLFPLFLFSLFLSILKKGREHATRFDFNYRVLRETETFFFIFLSSTKIFFEGDTRLFIESIRIIKRFEYNVPESKFERTFFPKFITPREQNFDFIAFQALAPSF